MQPGGGLGFFGRDVVRHTGRVYGQVEGARDGTGENRRGIHEATLSLYRPRGLTSKSPDAAGRRIATGHRVHKHGFIVDNRERNRQEAPRQVESQKRKQERK